jgi:tRNA (guanine-N7-)-methyltransferase
VTLPVEVATHAGCTRLEGPLGAGLLERWGPGGAPWELEIGFGKGRFLLARAAARPERRWLGVEIAGEYFRLAARRLARRGLANVVLLRGEALYLLAAVLPRGFAREVHVYFPDPWPKSRHHRRRLFSPASVDLVLSALEPGGRLCFATDHLDYGAEVEALLAGCPGLAVARLPGGWPEGARTNYEAKYVAESRPILRLEAVLEGAPALHPAGALEVLVAQAAAGAGGREPGAPGW